jgi:hypothetical protein
MYYIFLVIAIYLSDFILPFRISFLKLIWCLFNQHCNIADLSKHMRKNKGLELWSLMPLSTIFQLYRCGQFYRSTKRKPSTCHWQTLSHRYNWNIVESGIKDHNSSPLFFLICFDRSAILQCFDFASMVLNVKFSLIFMYIDVWYIPGNIFLSV